jgi:hypothetical protein
MQANLKHGKLVPPRSITAGRRRHLALTIEVFRIKQQLADPARAADEDWKKRASHVRDLLQSEERQLGAWLIDKENEKDRLLRKAYETLRVLEKEVDLRPEEARFMERLHQHFDYQ